MKMGDAIFAIAMTMTCTMCPIEDCEARYKSSMANCSSKWYDAFSKMEIENKEKAMDDVFNLWSEYKDSYVVMNVPIAGGKMGIRVEKLQTKDGAVKWIVIFNGQRFYFNTFEEAVNKAEECRDIFMSKEMQA